MDICLVLTDNGRKLCSYSRKNFPDLKVDDDVIVDIYGQRHATVAAVATVEDGSEIVNLLEEAFRWNSPFPPVIGRIAYGEAD